MCKCIGCGVVLQNLNELEIGYTKDITNKLCQRCFRIRNYNEISKVNATNEEYIDILKSINNSKDLVVLVVDLFNISKDLIDIKKYLNNDILLVLTKRDIIPRSCYDETLKKYFKYLNINFIDSIVVSSKKNYNIDELFNKINKYKKSNRVYVVGFTNSGKSTLINKLMYNYTSFDSYITTSNMPSTTIDSIDIKLSDSLTLIDTPGLLDEGDIINYVDDKTLKRIIPKQEIKPITYQVKCPQSFIIDNIFKIDILSKTNMTYYISNALKINRSYKINNDFNGLECYKFKINSDEDLVIQGLGFIHFTIGTDILIYIKEGINVFVRKSLI